jgi:RNA polymerase sigma factor (sigma-70 family)
VNEDDLNGLITRIASGDEAAFQRLMLTFQPQVQNFIQHHLNRAADREDILQETFINLYRALKTGKYQHINLAAFKQWLRTITWHLIIYANTSQKNAPQSLSYLDGEANEVFLDVPDETESPERQVTQVDLAGFLELQLDEVLIKSEPTGAGKDLGLLKKLAFMRFYVDQLTQKEVVAFVSEYAARLQLTQSISQSTINNWISRGDIIKGLVRHLVEEHYDFVQQVMDLVVAQSLDRREKKMLQDHWQLHQRQGESAGGPGSGDNTLASIKQKLSVSLFQHIKKQLHDVRHPKK